MSAADVEAEILHSWLNSSIANAKFFLFDLTRKKPDTVAVTEMDHEHVKGVVISSLRRADIGALWMTTRDDVQTGLEEGYYDVTKVVPAA